MKKVAVKKGKKAISSLKPKTGSKRISSGNRADKVDAAELSLVARLVAVTERLDASEVWLTKKIAESDKKIAESRAEYDKKIAESNAMIAESNAEYDKKIAESNARMAASKEESDKKMAASNAQYDATMANLARLQQEMKDSTNRYVGGLRQSIGYIVELVLLPGLKHKMNLLKHNFTMSSPRKEFSRPDGSFLAEVDLFLENCDEVMAIEVKTLFKAEDVDKHLERLKKLRENEAITGIRGKKMYGGAAGMQFAPDAVQKIKACGIYLIQIDENNDRITVTPPAGNAGMW
jgi:hypothetical protein